MAFHTDFADWMGTLPKFVRCKPITQIAIPGSHCSMSYAVSQSSGVAHDSEELIDALKSTGPLINATIWRWRITQGMGITYQLIFGIRYFHFRVGARSGQLFFISGLLGPEVEQSLREFVPFLDEHPKEVIILDFQKFYNCGTAEHARLRKILKDTFGSKIIERPEDVETISLHSMHKLGHQVIIVYRDQTCYSAVDLLPGDMFPFYAQRMTDPMKLLIKMNEIVAARKQNLGMVLPLVLIPSPRYFRKNMVSSLKERLARPMHENNVEWIRRQSPGPRGLNIVVSDFVGMKGLQFIKTVIGLNAKIQNKEQENALLLMRNKAKYGEERAFISYSPTFLD